MRADQVLTDIDRQSAAWLKVKKFLELRLALLRERNDRPGSQDKKNTLAGQIAEVKHLLSVGDPKAAVLPPEDELFPD